MSERYKKIKGENLAKFVDELAEEYPVYGPVENEGPVETEDEFSFEEISSLEEATLKHAPSMIPP